MNDEQKINADLPPLPACDVIAYSCIGENDAYSANAVRAYGRACMALRQQPIDRARIREVFMAHGFTVKEGQTDLKEYVYQAAEALLTLRQPGAVEPRMPTANGRPIETDAAHRLRLHATNANLPQDLRNALTKGADECDRFYDGMRAWKQTAEKKDADWNAERMARINDRCEARTTATAPVSQPCDLAFITKAAAELAMEINGVEDAFQHERLMQHVRTIAGALRTAPVSQPAAPYDSVAQNLDAQLRAVIAQRDAANATIAQMRGDVFSGRQPAAQEQKQAVREAATRKALAMEGEAPNCIGPLPALPEEKPTGQVYGIIDPDYGRIYTMVRKLAWEEGYAIGLHGSFTRDLDLIAVPWEQGNHKPEKLIARILQATGMREQHGNPGIKPHGRKVWTLLLPEFGDPRFIDLSIMPCPDSAERSAK